jgi:hypothetical protein
MTYSDTLPKVQDLVNNLLIVLSEKEKYIIENRFSLNDNPKLTLETIGQRYKVTRERIRQIEKNALKKLKRNVNNTALSDITTLALDIIDEFGGIIEEERMIEEVLRRSPDPEMIDVNSLKLTIDLEGDIEHVHNTIQYRPYWKTTEVKGSSVKAICNQAYKMLVSSKTIIDCETLATQIIKEIGLSASTKFVIAAFDLDRRLYVIDNKEIGLANWRSVNPKTLRDKIFFVLKNVTKPLHYIDISNRISSLDFDNKSINTQAVHNELIRHDGFVLIGRGIYALQEWGYEEGTVADVITSILQEKGEMKRDDIIAEVLERRQVKKITVQLNLKNKPEFERVGRDVYKLKKA